MINVDKIKIVQEKIKRALLQIEKEENITITFGSSKYDAAHYVTPMTVKTNDKNNEVIKIDSSISKRMGFTQNIIGMSFETPTGKYTIIDIKTRNRKFPIIAKAPNGVTYKYSVERIKNLIGGDKVVNRNANLEALFK